MTMSALRSTRTQLRSASGVRCAVPRPLALRSVRVRGSETPDRVGGTPPANTNQVEREKVPSNAANDALGVSGTPLKDHTVLNQTTEIINGRAAMIGIVAAIVSELVTHQSVWSQMAGKVVGDQMVERPSGLGFLLFAFVVSVTALSTLIPKANSGEKPEDRAVGPFTAGAELINGRAAQVGFLALIVIEAVKGSALFAA